MFSSRATGPHSSEEGTPYKNLRAFVWMPRPESGFDWPMSSELARQRTRRMASRRVSTFSSNAAGCTRIRVSG